MTGFARGQGQDADLSWSWEAKSVNGKGLDARFRLAGGYEFLELPARDAVQKRFKRGNLSVTLSVERVAADTPLVINDAVLARYVEVALRLQQAHPGLAPARIDGLMSLRGVLDVVEEVEDPEAQDRRGKAMLATLDQTLAAMAEMRAGEGRRLAEVLTAHLGQISALVEEARALAACEPEAIRERLRLAVSTLLDTVPAFSEERLAQEVALLAAKADVREELDRLRAHLAAAADLMAAGEAVGRRLDFLCQEFNREANTLCSKANDIELTRIGLALKAIIEQFREQVQNIE
jgi:uncharacterized protein (TIGR00255 family)